MTSCCKEETGCMSPPKPWERAGAPASTGLAGASTASNMSPSAPLENVPKPALPVPARTTPSWSTNTNSTRYGIGNGIYGNRYASGMYGNSMYPNGLYGGGVYGGGMYGGGLMGMGMGIDPDKDPMPPALRHIENLMVSPSIREYES